MRAGGGGPESLISGCTRPHMSGTGLTMPGPADLEVWTLLVVVMMSHAKSSRSPQRLSSP